LTNWLTAFAAPLQKVKANEADAFDSDATAAFSQSSVGFGDLERADRLASAKPPERELTVDSSASAAFA
jgi:hypothetical protein